MSDPRDPKEALAEQIAYWEERKAEAEKQLRYVDAVLPALKDSLRRLEEDEQAEGTDSGTTSSEATASREEGAVITPIRARTASHHPDDMVDPELTTLNSTAEIVALIEPLVTDLPQTFTHTDVLEAMKGHYSATANRSTLRTALLLMARDGKQFLLHEQGKGRRATVFRKI